MANFTAKDVQALRAKTGIGMMECKKALTEANGDIDRAVELLRERGLATAAKKADRVAAEGLVTTLIKGNTAVIVEVNSETDFVAKNADFVKFVNDVAQTIIDNKPADVAALLQLNLHGANDTVEGVLREKILVIGENLTVRRFEILEGAVADYLHANGRIAVILKFTADAGTVMGKDAFAVPARDIAMQVAAIAPKYISSDDVPADIVESEKKILTEQAINEGKPANIAEKMVEGRIRKFFSEICLNDQAFVKDGDFTVAGYLENASKALGADMIVEKFIRFEVGEGMEKREDNFADEVAGMMK